MIDRRQLLVAGLAAPIAAMALPALAATPTIVWEPGTLDSPHALLVARDLNHILREKVLYLTGEMRGMDLKIDLLDPRFFVRSNDIMWHPSRGFRYEPSLAVEFFDRGVRLGDTFMVSMGDYEAYWGKPKPDHYPDYWLKSPHLPYDDAERHRRPWEIRDEDWQVVESRTPPPYETQKGIEAKLGRDAVGFDMRWLEAMAKRQKEDAA